MKIAIRADGGLNIGLGHIMRTLNIASELRKNNDVFYICKNDKFNLQSGIKVIKNNGFDIKYIDHLQDVAKIQAKCLITDSYDVNEGYFDFTAELFKYTGYIDDMNSLKYYNVNFLVNHIAGAENFDYKVPNSCKLLLGTNFAIVKNEFTKIRNNKLNDNIQNILITVGGSNINNATEKILNCVSDLPFYFHVVIGPSFQEKDIVLINKYLNTNIKLHFNPQMYKLMENMDIIITACGGTVYEAISAGIPTVGFTLAKNQEYVANELSKKNAIFYLGDINCINKKVMCDYISYLQKLIIRQNIKNIMKDLIDGKGVKRISQIINSFN